MEGENKSRGYAEVPFMQLCGGKPSAAAGDYQRGNTVDLFLSYLGDPAERALFVQNVPLKWDKWKLFHIFRRFGRIDSIKVTRKADKPTFSCAYVYMLSTADARAVLAAVAENGGKLSLPELTKPLKIRYVRQKNEIKKVEELPVGDKGDAEKMKSDFAIKKIEKGSAHEPIIYNDRFHRHVYLPLEEQIEVELVKPIPESSHPPMIFHVLTETTMCEEENSVVTNRDFENYLSAHFKRAKQLKQVTKDELVVAAPKKSDEPPFRCRVLKKYDDDHVRIYALDIGKEEVVKMSELKVISEYLASVPARAIPCTLYGIHKRTSNFARVASRLLESIDRLAVRIVSFHGGIAFVRAFILDKFPSKEVAKILADEGVCEYVPPEARRVYSRETIMSLKEQQQHFPIPDRKVANMISVKPEPKDYSPLKSD